MKVDLLEFKAMMEPFGITDFDFIAFIYTQLIDADGFGGDGLEFGASVLRGLEPNDVLEVMLGVQMAVIPSAAMKSMRQVGDWRGTEFQERVVSTTTKLVRTFAALMEALKRHRTGGEQKVTVQHLQTIVGNVTQNALERSPLPALADALQPTMRIVDQPERAPVAVQRRRKNAKQRSA